MHKYMQPYWPNWTKCANQKLRMIHTKIKIQYKPLSPHAILINFDSDKMILLFGAAVCYCNNLLKLIQICHSLNQFHCNRLHTEWTRKKVTHSSPYYSISSKEPNVKKRGKTNLIGDYFVTMCALLNVHRLHIKLIKP